VKKPQSCLIKHSEKAKKVRRVTLEEIREYTELIRYRFIGYQ